MRNGTPGRSTRLPTAMLRKPPGCRSNLPRGSRRLFKACTQIGGGSRGWKRTCSSIGENHLRVSFQLEIPKSIVQKPGLALCSWAITGSELRSLGGLFNRLCYKWGQGDALTSPPKRCVQTVAVWGTKGADIGKIRSATTFNWIPFTQSLSNWKLGEGRSPLQEKIFE